MSALRIFFGLELPEAQRGQLALQQFLLPLPQKTLPQDFHLTLAFLGELPDAAVQAAHDEALGVDFEPFELTLADLGLFGGARPRVVWAGVRPSAPLVALQARLAARLLRAHLPLDTRRFAPHVTLGRFGPPPPELALRLERAVALTRFALPPFPVTSFALFQSLPASPHGRYPVLARYAARL